MKLPKIDDRSKEDIIKYIKKYLSSYTPEWRFDENNPDVGTALAYIYAEMMSETVYRFNQVSDKNMVMFFNKVGARLLPAVPAVGYVTFSLVNDEVEGVEVKSGEEVLADDLNGETQVFETLNDVYVSPAQPYCLYFSNRERDQISRLFDYSEENQTADSYALFDLHKTNLQEHVIYFSHPSILQIEREAWVYCDFRDIAQRQFSPELLQQFLRKDNVSFEYYSEEGFLPFEEQTLRHGQIALRKGERQPGFALYEYEGILSYWIRCRVSDVKPFSQFAIKNMAIRSGGQQILPDAVNVDGVDQNVREFFPFGERASLYNEVYFISDEVFGKKGAGITLDFDLDFLKLPLEIQDIESEINWKAVMKRGEIKADIEYDISIAEVIWEYYNGDGFARLFVNHQYSDVFSIQNGTAFRRVTLHFRCPEDLQPVLVNSSNACCIRARVLKMNNLYKMKGNYISPLISNPRLKYEYLDNNLVPECFLATNNLDTVRFPNYTLRNNEQEFFPLESCKDDTSTLYLGFEQPPIGGPIKLLFALEDNMQMSMPILLFEYSTRWGWKNLNVIDETENFRKTGILTMMGSKDFEKKRLFGRECYWIRLMDANNEYLRFAGSRPLQKLLGIHMNTTRIMAVETKEPELFYIAPNEENKVCKLLEGRIHKIQVWVNEFKTIHKEELAELEKTCNVRYEYAQDGEIAAIWVEWDEVLQFDTAEPKRRCYLVDRIEGSVTFPDGKNGKIPTWDESPTIQIIYSCGGGEVGNLPKHRVNRLNRNIGFISEVDNYEITTGGCDQEQLQDALGRNAAAIRHGYRAVTVSDYEDLAKEACRNISKAKCFSNKNELGETEYGHVTLVVFQKDYESGKKYFDSVKAQIFNYMKDRISSHLLEREQFHVIEPVYLRMSVTVTLQVAEYDEVFEVHEGVSKRLEEFLNPITGNYNQKGWEIGSMPNTTQILNALKEVRGIHYIENVRLSTYQQGLQGLVEVDIYKMRENPYILPLSGVHEIIIKMKDT